MPLPFSRGSLLVVACVAFPTLARAQTDFYNTDRDRPLRVEDAYVTERYAAELKLASVRLQRLSGGTYNWGLEPEIAVGILPRTQLEVGLPLALIEQGSERRSGIAGLEFSAMHNFNVETEGMPALALRGDMLVPVGSLGPDRLYTSATGIATRTYRWARFHVNGQYTFGTAPAAGAATSAGIGGIDVSRWLMGGAIDKSYPLESSLVTAELYGRKPLDSNSSVKYTAGAGMRVQLTPTLAADGGLGRRVNGPEQGWYATFGTAWSFGVRSLFPGAH